MKGLWNPDASVAQKWLIGIFLSVMLGAMVPIFSRGFIPSDVWQLQALYISLALTALGLVWLRVLYKRGQWKPAGPWQDYGPLKRLLMIPLCLGFWLLVLWLNLAATLPKAYNQVFATEVQTVSSATKKRSSGRYSCHYQLKLPEVRYMFFEFCIDEQAFDQLPDGPMPARLTARQSYFGRSIDSIALVVRRAESE
ncbi:MAG: hypothetical protein LBJ15_02975 [Comamonas sp.]|jgi:hypothetical protein|uniref:hypothetical protein n=1 Tax=Comamonas sp. TaxID=34028 RepID=UPI002837F3C1|nr:hypothetical protein [Comamonas sp.]MDR0212949.1 hypothetical protein [Comamonas sp.]